MNVILRLVPNRFCVACSTRGFVVSKTQLCLYCTDRMLRVAERQVKLRAQSPLPWCFPPWPARIRTLAHFDMVYDQKYPFGHFVKKRPVGLLQKIRKQLQMFKSKQETNRDE